MGGGGGGLCYDSSCSSSDAFVFFRLGVTTCVRIMLFLSGIVENEDERKRVGKMIENQACFEMRGLISRASALILAVFYWASVLTMNATAGGHCIFVHIMWRNQIFSTTTIDEGSIWCCLALGLYLHLFAVCYEMTQCGAGPTTIGGGTC